MNKIKAIIFDFDGVIAESVNVKTEAFAELFRPYGKSIENKVVVHHLRNGGMSRFEKFRFYHTEYLQKTITKDEIQQLSKRFSELVVKKVIEAPYIKGAKEFLEKLHQKLDFFISSGTPQDEIRFICKERGIEHLFKGIYGSPGKKEEHVQNILKKYHYNEMEVIFIGDAESDRKAARMNSIVFIGIINDRVDFFDEKFKIYDLSDLDKTIKGINHR